MDIVDCLLGVIDDLRGCLVIREEDRRIACGQEALKKGKGCITKANNNNRNRLIKISNKLKGKSKIKPVVGD